MQVASLKLTASATFHCPSRLRIGEIAGILLGAHFGWSNVLTTAAAFILAYIFGYLLMKRGRGHALAHQDLHDAGGSANHKHH